jgi:hypothetical protein
MNLFGPLEFIHKTWGEIESQDENYRESVGEKKEGIKLFVSPKFLSSQEFHPEFCDLSYLGLQCS